MTHCGSQCWRIGAFFMQLSEILGILGAINFQKMKKFSMLAIDKQFLV